MDSITGSIVSSTFNVLFKCTQTVDCSASVQSSLSYFISETTELTIPGCTITPAFCLNTTTGTVTSTGASTPAGGFATLTKNANNSFKITMFSNDSLTTGRTYQF